MSNRRSIAWLLFLVALAVAAHLFLTWRGGRETALVRAPVLVEGADGAFRITIARTNAPAVTLTREGSWRIDSPFAAAAEQSTVLRLVDVFAFAPVSDVLSDAEMHKIGRSLADFGLAFPSLAVAVRIGEKERTVRFGNRTPAGDGVYASVSGTPSVCVVPTNLFASVDLTLDALRRRELFLDGLGAAVSVDIRRAAGQLVRIAFAQDGWQLVQPTDEAASLTRVTALLDSLAKARAVRFVWPSGAEKTASAAPSAAFLSGYGLDAESAVAVTLKDAAGASETVSFGKSAGEGLVYALVQNGRAVVTVDAKIVDPLLAGGEAFADRRLFPHEVSELKMLSVTDGDTVYLLARGADGVWRLDSPVSAPADPEAVQSLVAGVLSLKTTELDPQGLVVSVTTNGKPVAVSRDSILAQNRFANLRSKTVLKLPGERIRRLSVTSSEGRQDAVVWDADKRSWLLVKPENAELDGLAFAGVLAALDPLPAVSVVRLRVAASEVGNYGLEKPRFTIAVDPQGEGAVRRNVLIGTAAPGGGCYATVGASDAVFVLSDKTVQALTTPFATTH